MYIYYYFRRILIKILKCIFSIPPAYKMRQCYYIKIFFLQLSLFFFCSYVIILNLTALIQLPGNPLRAEQVLRFLAEVEIVDYYYKCSRYYYRFTSIEIMKYMLFLFLEHKKYFNSYFSSPRTNFS